MKNLWYVIIIMKEEWKNYINKGGSANVTVCNDEHAVIKKKELKKLRYVMIIMKL